MDEKLYRPPGSDLGPVPQEPSRRLAQCSIAWLSGFSILPAAIVCFLMATGEDAQGEVLQSINLMDVLGFMSAGTISALAVAPFRRLPLWIPMLAGLLPVVLFSLLAVAISVFGRAA